jgi:hypothetical protein
MFLCMARCIATKRFELGEESYSLTLFLNSFAPTVLINNKIREKSCSHFTASVLCLQNMFSVKAGGTYSNHGTVTTFQVPQVGKSESHTL